MRNLFWILALAAFGTACVRSPAYRRDQDYTRDSTQSYYASKDKKTPTQRLEAMGQPKKRVAVLNFWNDTPLKYADLGVFATDELKRSLSGTQRLIVPEDAKTELGTSDLVQGDSVRVEQLMREGRRLGVAALVIGRVTKAVFRQRGDEVGLLRQKQSLAAVDVEVKLFDIMAGREIMAVARSGEASSNAMVALEGSSLESREYRSELTKLAVRNAVVQVVGDIARSIEKMTWEGRIAKIQNNKVYVNAGRAAGLVGGDILRVLTPGDDIYDPATGTYLGRTKGQLKGTLEVVDFIGTDGAVTEVHTGANFQEGDVVQLY